MGLFSRRTRREPEAAHAEAQPDEAEVVGARATGSTTSTDGEAGAAGDGQPQDAARRGRERGPWDVTEAPERSRVDLGALLVPAVDGLQLRMERSGPQEPSVAVALILGGSSLELRAFAAPRSEGLWEDLRTELGEQLREMGASYQLLDGDYGVEVLARVPVAAAGGEAEAGAHDHVTALRFIGVDGPRWFLRGVLLGPAATDDSSAQELRDILADTVVVRGNQPRPPREILELHAPGASPRRGGTETEHRGDGDLLAPGPTLTEVR